MDDTGQRYVCPACAAEGNPEPQPAGNFYWITVKDFKSSRSGYHYKDNKRRSTLCKKHDRAAAAARQRRRLDPASDEYDEAYAKRVAQQKRESKARRRKLKGSDGG